MRTHQVCLPAQCLQISRCRRTGQFDLECPQAAATLQQEIDLILITGAQVKSLVGFAVGVEVGEHLLDHPSLPTGAHPGLANRSAGNDKSSKA